MVSSSSYFFLKEVIKMKNKIVLLSGLAIIADLALSIYRIKKAGRDKDEKDRLYFESIKNS